MNTIILIIGIAFGFLLNETMRIMNKKGGK